MEAEGLELGGRSTAGGDEGLKLASATPTELCHGVWECSKGGEEVGGVLWRGGRMVGRPG